MTPKIFFQNSPRGTLKDAFRRIGYSYHYMCAVVNEKRPCSSEFAKCLEEYSKGIITKNEAMIQNKFFTNTQKTKITVPFDTFNSMEKALNICIAKHADLGKDVFIANAIVAAKATSNQIKDRQ